jgi:hypothetical protein
MRTCDAPNYERDTEFSCCGCGFEFAERGGWRLCGAGSSVQHMSAEDDGTTGDLLSQGTVQRAACSDYQTGLPD